MDIKEIKQIVDLMKRSGLTEFQIEENDFKLRICRRNEETQTMVHTGSTPPFAVPQNAPAPPQPTPEGNGTAESASTPKEAEGKLIRSPMVGTFYTSPAPESPPFVKVADSVSEETVVCILEAMKVMNEIKAETKGVIAEILVEDGESVEYGQPLFRLK